MSMKKVRKDLLVMSFIFLSFSIYEEFLKLSSVLRLQDRTIFDQYFWSLIFSIIFAWFMLRGHKFAMWILSIFLIFSAGLHLYIMLFVVYSPISITEFFKFSDGILFRTFIWDLYCIFLGIYIIATRNKKE